MQSIKLQKPLEFIPSRRNSEGVIDFYELIENIKTIDFSKIKLVHLKSPSIQLRSELNFTGKTAFRIFHRSNLGIIIKPDLEFLVVNVLINEKESNDWVDQFITTSILASGHCKIFKNGSISFKLESVRNYE